MGEVIPFNRFRLKSHHEEHSKRYQSLICRMDKLELMEEMVRFQQKRSSVGQLTPEMMVEGKILFKALTENAETHELRILTRSYMNHLNYEYEDYLKRNV